MPLFFMTITESIDYFSSKSLHKIGILDSGIGGLTVLQHLVEAFPAHYYYFADSANLPYGNKSKKELLSISLKNIETLLTYNVDAIVLACHTLCTTVLDELKNEFPQVIFIDVVQPVVQKALLITKNNYIGVLGTTATIESHCYKKIFAQKNLLVDISEIACPELASLIETYPVDDDRIKNSIKRSMAIFQDMNIDTLILGCTHYALVKDIIQSFTNAEIVSAETELFFYFKNIFGESSSKNDQLSLSFILLPSNTENKKYKKQLYHFFLQHTSKMRFI